MLDPKIDEKQEDIIREKYRRCDLSEEDNIKLSNIIINLAIMGTKHNINIGVIYKKIDVFMSIECEVKHSGFIDVRKWINVVKKQNEVDTKYRIKMNIDGIIIIYIPTNGATEDFLKYIKHKPTIENKISEITKVRLKDMYNSIVDVKKIFSPKRLSAIKILKILKFLTEYAEFQSKSVNMKIYDEKKESFHLIMSGFVGEIDLTDFYDFFSKDGIKIYFNPNTASISFFIMMEKFQTTENGNIGSGSKKRKIDTVRSFENKEIKLETIEEDRRFKRKKFDKLDKINL